MDGSRNTPIDIALRRIYYGVLDPRVKPFYQGTLFQKLS